MALLTSELMRIRAELGYNALGVGAEPYVGITAVFDQIVAVYLNKGATTTSATAVTAADAATPVDITLASAVGFSAGDRVVLDVDARQEAATVQAIAGSVITVLLTGAHSGTYPVTVDGGETLVREKLRLIQGVADRIEAAAATAGLKRAEDVEWFQARSGGSAQLQDLQALRDYHRDQLAGVLGVANAWRLRKAALTSSELY